MKYLSRSVIVALLLLPPAWAQAQQASSNGWAGGISPGDIVVVRIAREPAMEVNQIVPTNGLLAFQRIGPIDVRGMSEDSLRAMLVKQYARYLTEPEARIHVDHMRKVTVTGAVNKPNVYTLHHTMSVADAIATAGGALPEGRTDRVELRRDGKAIQLLLFDGTSLANSPIRSGDQLYVPERSFMSRNLSVILPAVTSVVALTIALIAQSK